MARSKRRDARSANTWVLSPAHEGVLQADDEIERSYTPPTRELLFSGPAVHLAPFVRRRLLASRRQSVVFSPLPRRALPPASATRSMRPPVWYRGAAFFCLQRSKRREVMFAKRFAGARAYKHRRARRTLTSNYGCR